MSVGKYNIFLYFALAIENSGLLSYGTKYLAM